ncbi:MAG: hypothetical protein WDO24_01275 [Pseudomonadota bacterium]
MSGLAASERRTKPSAAVLPELPFSRSSGATTIPNSRRPRSS